MTFLSQTKTTILLVILSLFMLWIGVALAGDVGLTIAFIIMLIFNFVSYWYYDKLVLKLYGAEDSPVVNPAFVISNWEGDVSITVNGKKLEKNSFKTGKPRTVIDKDLVVWLDYTSIAEIEVVIEK